MLQVSLRLILFISLSTLLLFILPKMARRQTEPDRDVALLLARLKLELPPQPPSRIVSVKTTENQAM